jgi:putative transposase
MGRHPRIEGKNLAYYVSSKGKDGQNIFKDDQDKIYFVNLLKQQKIKSKLTFYGYVLLPDLYACLMETCKNNFIQSMHRINSGYANYLNRRYQHKNKLFHDRYKSYIIEKKFHLAEVSRYLHLLPVKAGVAKSPIHYEWSSFQGYIFENKREDWISFNTILDMFNTTDQKAAFQYQKYVDTGIEEKMSSPFKDLKEGIILGSEDFKGKLYKKLEMKEIGFQKEEFALAKTIIQLVNQSSFWPSLKRKKSVAASSSLMRNATIYFIKKYTDLSNHQINQFFQSLKKSSISQMSRRFTLAKENNPSLEKTAKSLESKIKAIVLNSK